ncbi:MAG: hypothetical protein VW985_04425 [Gammaproteobacteria bacterium]
MTRPTLVLAVAMTLSLMAGCGADPVQQAYDDCMAQVGEAKMETNNEAMKGMVEGMQKMAESACGMILTTCESDPEGAICQGMISQYSENQ